MSAFHPFRTSGAVWLMWYETAMTAYQSMNLFRTYLLPGERVLWTGQPKQGLALSGRDAVLIPFSLMWGGFAIFWNVGVWTFPKTGEDTDWFMRLWGLPFLVVGLYLIIGRFIHDAWIRKRLFYAVTNQRVLILRGLNSQNLKSLDIRRLPKLDLSEHSDGTGTLEFDGDSSLFSSRRNGFGSWTPALSAASQFFRIANPRKVYGLIRDQAHSVPLTAESQPFETRVLPPSSIEASNGFMADPAHRLRFLVAALLLVPFSVLIVIASGRFHGQTHAPTVQDRCYNGSSASSLQEALTACNDWITMRPKESEAYLSRGLIYLNNWKLDPAVADFSRAHELNPRSPWPLANRGISYAWKSDRQRAESDFEAVRKLDPANSVLLHGEAVLDMESGDLEDEIRQLNAGLARNPNDAWSLQMRSDAYQQRGDFEQARADRNALAHLRSAAVGGAARS